MFELLLATGAKSMGPDPAIPFAIFGGGRVTVESALTESYVYSTAVVASATQLAQGEVSAIGTSTYSVGIMFGGMKVSPTTYRATIQKYTYSSGAWNISSAMLGMARRRSAAAGNATQAIIQGGDNGSRVNYGDKYSYGSETIVAATLLSSAREGMFGSGNGTVGVFSAGGVLGAGTVTTTDLYAHATDAVSGGTAIGTARYLGAAAGTPTLGLFAFGSGTATAEKYTYANNTRANGTGLGTGRSNTAGTGTAELALFGGSGTPSATTVSYTYAGDTVLGGTNLITARGELAAFSSSPGGF